MNWYKVSKIFVRFKMGMWHRQFFGKRMVNFAFFIVRKRKDIHLCKYVMIAIILVPHLG